MRAILKKLHSHQPLDADEYQSLMDYIKQLQDHSPSSYQVFHQNYGEVLYQHYATYLPQFEYGLGDVVSLLAAQPQLLMYARQRPVPWEHFPPPYQPFLKACAGMHQEACLFHAIVAEMNDEPQRLAELPRPRDYEVVMRFEDDNPFKEIGLKAHFERLSRFRFITRLQSIRYLSVHKAKQDRVEVVAPDRLGGIFTNKEKSIYYYIYLTESSRAKAGTACALINLACYGPQRGDSHEI